MTVIASQVPDRSPNGLTSDPPYGPWADIGCGNPFFYHLFSDDFDNAFGATGLWTVSITAASGATAVHNPGDGGQVILTTGAASTNYISAQLPAADFTLPQGTLAGKKMGFLFRLVGLSDITNSAFIIGMVDTTTTPFTTITDGIYFNKASGSTQITLKVVSASTVFTYNIPTSHYVLANNTQLDFAWAIDRNGNILVSIGAQLVGWIPQSGTGAGTAAPGFYPSAPVLCPTDKLFSGNPNSSGFVASGYTLTTALLNPTFGIQTGAAAAKTLTADFIGVAKER